MATRITSDLAYAKVSPTLMIDIYLPEDAGHGSPQFFDPSIVAKVIAFFDRYLK